MMYILKIFKGKENVFVFHQLKLTGYSIKEECKEAFINIVFVMGGQKPPLHPKTETLKIETFITFIKN